MPISTKNQLLRHKVIFWTIMVIIAGASLLAFASIQRLLALSDRVETTQSVLLELSTFVSDLKDVETGARGYALTGESRYLAPFNSGLVNAPQSLDRLHDLIADDPRQLARLDRLKTLSSERLALAQQLAGLGGNIIPRDTARAILGRGKVRMDAIRRDVAAMIAAERNRYRIERNAVDEQARITAVIMLGGILISLAVLGELFVSRSRDINRRAAAEAELRTLNAELEDRVQARTAEIQRVNEICLAVIDNIPDTVSLEDADDDYRYVLWNAAAERMTGERREGMIGRNAFDLFARQEAEHYRADNERLIASGQPSAVLEEAVTTVLGPRIMEICRIPIRDAQDGHWRYVLNVTRDLTEQRNLEKQVRQTQRMDAIGQLTGGLAHDFNNLLAIIMGNVDLLREKTGDVPGVDELAEEALDAAERGDELVRRLLAFARQQHLEPVAIDLNERLPDTTALLQRTLGERIRVKIVPGVGLWPTLIDPGQADDALVNLAINARDAMPNGGSLVIETANVVLDEDYAAQHVEVSPGDYVMLSVSDTGTGMTPETAIHAFEPFFTTKEPGKGTGLGLSQVYGWVKQSGGHVKIYSEIGHGTTIKLYLPRAEEEAGAPGADPEMNEHMPMGGETVLVVEDNPNVRSVVVRQLQELGYATLEAEDGRDALVIVQSAADFDLVLTDVVMPGGMTGYELAVQIEALRPGMKVLFTSGYTELAVRNGNGHSNGNGNGHKAPLLSKPYRKQELARAIRAQLDAE